MKNTSKQAAQQTAFVYSPHLSDYQLSESHPFKPIRLELTRSLLHTQDFERVARGHPGAF